MKETTIQDIIGLQIVGYRYGIAPENGYSYNTREREYEPGVSMACVCYGKEIQSFATDAQATAKKYFYAGEIIGIGSDNEICITNIRRISYKEYCNMRKSMIFENNKVVNFYADQKLRLLKNGWNIGCDENKIEEYRNQYLR